jgi:site-specific recombinase XerD
MDDFTRYLANERGLSEASIENYSGFARRFLEERFGTEPPEPPNFSLLAQPDVTSFVLRHAPSYSHGRNLLMTTALRSFFRYLLLRDQIVTNLAGTVPKVANWSLQSLPKSMEPEQVQQLLKQCNRRTPVGKRDYALLLLLARLGLRAGEIAHLSLDAIDWEAGEIILFGKSRRVDRLPLPCDVGKAIVAYLKSGRPTCSSRHLFIQARAPYDGFKPRTVSCLVRRSLRRAGLTPPRGGAHLLRHTLAKQMLRRGATLTEIGQVLRHQNVDTTAIYAKVDLDALGSLALPWPGGAL